MSKYWWLLPVVPLALFGAFVAFMIWSMQPEQLAAARKAQAQNIERYRVACERIRCEEP